MQCCIKVFKFKWYDMFVTETRITRVQLNLVWDVLMDHQRWHQWNETIRKVTCSGSLEKGKRGEVFYRNGSRVRFQVSGFAPGSSYTLSFRTLLATIHIRRFVGYHNHQTTITNEVWADGVLSDLWWTLFSSTYIQMLSNELDRFIEMIDVFEPSQF